LGRPVVPDALRRRSSSCLHQGSPRFGSIKARSRSVPDDHAPADARDLVRRRKPRREVGFVDKQRGAAIVEGERDLRVLVAGAERNRYRAEPQDGEERDHEFRPVADEKGHAIRQRLFRARQARRRTPPPRFQLPASSSAVRR
jgi:hypothetical protein